MKKPGPTQNVGDVFQFDVAGKGIAYGQIVVPGDSIYVIVYRGTHNHGTPLPDLQRLSDIALCGWTLDGRIYRGMWRIIGNAPLPEGIPRPCYKVANEGLMWIESFEGELKRNASEEDCHLLDYRATVAPIRFEKALSAIHGLQDWDQSFEKLRVEYAREKERAC